MKKRKIYFTNETRKRTKCKECYVRGWELLTNFDHKYTKRYEEAISAYQASGGIQQLKVSNASNEYCDKGLWILERTAGDCTSFWKIYDGLKDNKC